MRINAMMTEAQAVVAMVGGNPGATTVCALLMRDNGRIDPDAFMGGLGTIMFMDTLGIYESRIWMFYKDVCGCDLSMMIAVLRAHQLGQLAGVTDHALHHAIDNCGDGLDLDAVRQAVQSRLPNFCFEQSDEVQG